MMLTDLSQSEMYFVFKQQIESLIWILHSFKPWLQ